MKSRMLLAIVVTLTLVLAACAPQPTPTEAPVEQPTEAQLNRSHRSPCRGSG